MINNNQEFDSKILATVKNNFACYYRA